MLWTPSTYEGKDKWKINGVRPLFNHQTFTGNNFRVQNPLKISERHTSKMNIRKAIEKDTAQWSEMRTALWPETSDGHLSEIKEYFAGKSVDIVQVYIAEIGSEAIGFMELNIRNFAEGSRSSKLPYVEGWYIKPQYQGRGYGKQLMKAAEQWAISQGYSELASDTEVDNKRSISIHEHLGFTETERIVCFLKRLG